MLQKYHTQSLSRSAAQVTIEKNKIATGTRAASLEEGGSETGSVNELISECTSLLKAEGLLDEALNEVDATKMVLNCEELKASPQLTMKVRLLITWKLWSYEATDNITSDSLISMVDADPFLSSLDDMRKANGLVCAKDVLRARNEWSSLTTVRGPKHSRDRHRTVDSGQGRVAGGC